MLLAFGLSCAGGRPRGAVARPAVLPIDDAMVRSVFAMLFGLAGVVMMSARLHDRVSGAFTPLASAAARLSSKAGDGFGSQFAVGALVGRDSRPGVSRRLA